MGHALILAAFVFCAVWPSCILAFPGRPKEHVFTPVTYAPDMLHLRFYYEVCGTGLFNKLYSALGVVQHVLRAKRGMVNSTSSTQDRPQTQWVIMVPSQLEFEGHMGGGAGQARPFAYFYDARTTERRLAAQGVAIARDFLLRDSEALETGAHGEVRQTRRMVKWAPSKEEVRLRNVERSYPARSFDVPLRWLQCEADLVAYLRNLSQTYRTGMFNLQLVPGWKPGARKRKRCAFSFVNCLQPPVTLDPQLIPLHNIWKTKASGAVKRLGGWHAYISIHLRVEFDMRKWCQNCDALNVTRLHECMTKRIAPNTQQIVYIMGGHETETNPEIKAWRTQPNPQFQFYTKAQVMPKDTKASYQGWAAIDASIAVYAAVHIGFKGSTLSDYVHAYRRALALPGHDKDFSYNEVCMNGVPALPPR
mmetsp:Transcript_4732/g.8547  ORF Transcript_4732/g.8547 Transcript_4732/m.8547 type:complete len:420 (-) Transcript_4732:244-1503(-)